MGPKYQVQLWDGNQREWYDVGQPFEKLSNARAKYLDYPRRRIRRVVRRDVVETELRFEDIFAEEPINADPNVSD